MKVKLFSLKIIISLATLSRATFFDSKKALLSVKDSEPSFSQSGEQSLQHWNSQVGSSKSPTANLFPRESDYIPQANQQQLGEKRSREGVLLDAFTKDPESRPALHLGLSQSAFPETENQTSEIKKLRLSSLSTPEHGLKHSDIVFESAHNEPGSHNDLSLDLLRSDMEKRHSSTSDTLDQGLKNPQFSSTSSSKDREVDNHHIDAAHFDFFKVYEKIHLDKVKSGLVSPDKELRTERWVYSPTTEERSNIDRSLQEGSKHASIRIENASKSNLFDKAGDKASNEGNENQGAVFKNIKKASDNVSASTKLSSNSEIDDKLKNQWINTGGSSSKDALTKNFPTFTLIIPPEVIYDQAIDLDAWRDILSQPSRSYNIIAANTHRRKLYNPGLSIDDSLYVKGKEVVPLTERSKSDQFEKLFLDAITPDSSVSLTSLKQYVYDDHKFNEIVTLQSLDNYVESFFKRLRNKAFCTDIVLRSMIGLKSPSEKDTKMIKGHKVKAWSQYKTRFRLKVLPEYYGCEFSLLMLVTEEMGFRMGIRRLKDLKIYKEIKSFGRELKKMPHLQGEPGEKWVHLANKITIAALYKIILLYQIFTPFDSEAIENLKINQLACARKLYTAWKEIMKTENPVTFITDHQVEYSNIDPFLNDAFINQILYFFKDNNYKRFLAYGSNYILNFWLKHRYANVFEFLSWDHKSKLNQGFFTFLNDCIITDFIETYPK
ncbi:hypothetical protein PPACK8108_LOCUS25125 [Phakopsora pachyrhizi]|uniref:Uncharacterized protein n=1 Tax=Phakopsora pachyrhizi TaxID=170000 RepID=A0AAV0BUL3_PHAPC|nr:hypothetical protein PPACK8108_LOCUS25125 [Phakopsora pachyrhizi]